MTSEKAHALGSVGPTADGVDLGFWVGLQQGKLRIQRCTQCRRWIWPAVWRCGTCGSWNIAWDSVSPIGRVFSWIRTWQAFSEEFTDCIPYVTLLVELPAADNKRMLGILAGEDCTLRIGSLVDGFIHRTSLLPEEYPIMRWRLVGDAVAGSVTEADARAGDRE